MADKTREVLRNQHMLRASQEILAHLPMPVLGIDPDGYLVMVNRAAESKLGVSAASLGKLASEVLPVGLLEAIEHGINPCLLEDRRRVGYWCYPLGPDDA